MNALKKVGIGLAIAAGAVLLLGIVLLPLGEAIVGGMMVYSTAVAKGLGSGACIALGGAGAVGGLVAGKLVTRAVGTGLASVLKPSLQHLVTLLKQSAGTGPSTPAPAPTPAPAAQQPAKDPKDEFDAKAAITLKKDIKAPKLVWKTKPPSSGGPGTL